MPGCGRAWDHVRVVGGCVAAKRVLVDGVLGDDPGRKRVIVPAPNVVANGSNRMRWYSGTVSWRRRSRSIRSTVIKPDAGGVKVWRVRAHRWRKHPDYAIQAAAISRTAARASIVPSATAAPTSFSSPAMAILTPYIVDIGTGAIRDRDRRATSGEVNQRAKRTLDTAFLRMG